MGAHSWTCRTSPNCGTSRSETLESDLCGMDDGPAGRLGHRSRFEPFARVEDAWEWCRPTTSAACFAPTWWCRVSQHRKHRGYASQRIVAEYLRDHGFPYAEPVGAGRDGTDVTGVPGLDIEVKARRGFNPAAAMRQQEERAEPTLLPFAVLRLDGQGPAVIENWPVIVRFGAFIPVLRDAGWGEPR